MILSLGFDIWMDGPVHKRYAQNEHGRKRILRLEQGIDLLFLQRVRRYY